MLPTPEFLDIEKGLGEKRDNEHQSPGSEAHDGQIECYHQMAAASSKVGVVLEKFLNGDQSLELTVGTWSFKEISTSLVIKRYFLSNDLDAGWYKPIHPFIGAGLWVVGAKPPAERLGLALNAIVPIGIDWSFPFDADPSCNNRSCPVGNHALGVSVNLNRALLVRRSNPEDQLPLNGRLVPLPGAYYRFMTRH